MGCQPSSVVKEGRLKVDSREPRYRSPLNMKVAAIFVCLLITMATGGPDQRGPLDRKTSIVSFGPGLEGGSVNQPAVFTVWTNGETGSITFGLEGPSQTEIDYKDNGDGSFDVTYGPTMPGVYAVHILCNNEDIPKSPYMVDIKPAADFNAAKVNVKGPGLEIVVSVNKWAEFTVDTRAAGKAALIVQCLEVDYKEVEVQVKDNGDGTYSCRYLPTSMIKHTIFITYGGVATPNSPFRVYVSELTQSN